MALTPGHHAYCPMASGEDMAAVGTKDLYAFWIVFRLHGHVPSLVHRILLMRATLAQPPCQRCRKRRGRTVASSFAVEGFYTGSNHKEPPGWLRHPRDTQQRVAP